MYYVGRLVLAVNFDFKHIHVGNIYMIFSIHVLSSVRMTLTVLAELDGSHRLRRFSQASTVLTDLDGSRRTRRFSQTSTVLVVLDGSRRTRHVLSLMIHYNSCLAIQIVSDQA